MKNFFITKEGAVGEKITELDYWKAGVLPWAPEDYRKKHYSYIKFIFQQNFKGQTTKSVEQGLNSKTNITIMKWISGIQTQT